MLMGLALLRVVLLNVGTTEPGDANIIAAGTALLSWTTSLTVTTQSSFHGESLT
jgi:hypothetical protein